MRTPLCRTFRTAVFFLVLVLPVSAQEPGQAYTVRVQSVIDGSTYDVRVSEGQSFTIRLWGTNAPETSQPCGTDATARARKFLAVYPRVCGATVLQFVRNWALRALRSVYRSNERQSVAGVQLQA